MLFWRRRSVARVWYRSEGVLLHRKNLMLQCLIVWKHQKRLVQRQSPCFRKRCYLSRKGLHNCLFQTFFLFRKRHLKMEGCRLPLNWWKGLVHRYQSPSHKKVHWKRLDPVPQFVLLRVFYRHLLQLSRIDNDVFLLFQCHSKQFF